MTSAEGYSLALSTVAGSRSEINPAVLVETYSTLLFRVAHSILRSQAEAEDVVQDVFVRVLEHRGSLSAVRDMRVWLIRIAWNLAIDRRRRINPDQMDESFARALVAKSLPADEAIDEARRMQLVLRELERLPKGERTSCFFPSWRSWGQRSWRRFWEEANLLFELCSFAHERDCASGSRKGKANDERSGGSD
jgi:RNA polymerase sigma-70 factor (ECF subfamily)